MSNAVSPSHPKNIPSHATGHDNLVQTATFKTTGVSENQYKFLSNLDDDLIQDFLWMDSCTKISDKVSLLKIHLYHRDSSI